MSEKWPDADVYDREGNFAGTKGVLLYDGDKVINDWVATFGNNDFQSKSHGTLLAIANDFQNQGTVRLCQPNKPWNHQFQWQVTADNVLESCIYLSVRLCIEASWLNDRDQFLFPNDGWKGDSGFAGDCLVHALFHGQNRISSSDGPNHWIPFTESEVGARERFASHFMTDFMAGKHCGRGGSAGVRALPNTAEPEGDLHSSTSNFDSPLVFSLTAQAVLDAGRELWRYYHAQPGANPNASYYDIRKHFQGMKKMASGKEQMNATSADATYNAFLDALKKAMKELAKQIEPKVYEYGFLKR